MSEYPLTTADGQIQLKLTRYGDIDTDSPPEQRRPVLLLHGASANHGTFEIGDGGGLAKWLVGRGFDPWLLDWRGSSLVVDDPDNRLKRVESFNFNAAAAYDIRPALEKMREQKVRFPIAAIGHCMGSGVLAEAIARKHVNPFTDSSSLTPKDKDIDCVVLLTLGLFYETPLDSRMKSEERVLDRLRAEKTVKGEFVRVDPRVKDAKGDLEEEWPEELTEMFEDWPGRQFHSDELEQQNAPTEPCRIAKYMCNRLSFMYGMPYYHGNLVDEIHGTSSNPPVLPVLKDQFGAIPLHMYLHAAQNIRRRHATFYEDKNLSDEVFISDAARGQFSDLDKVTLITGARNRLWHRNSIDLMYEWLTQGRLRPGYRVQKHILPNYGHQDLLWGKKAPADVYEFIEKGLRPEPSPVTAPGDLHDTA